jgi:hypothetical protein
LAVGFYRQQALRLAKTLETAAARDKLTPIL